MSFFFIKSLSLARLYQGNDRRNLADPSQHLSLLAPIYFQKHPTCQHTHSWTLTFRLQRFVVQDTDMQVRCLVSSEWGQSWESISWIVYIHVRQHVHLHLLQSYLSQTYVHASLAMALISGSISTNTALDRVSTDDIADITVFHLFPDFLLSMMVFFARPFGFICHEITNWPQSSQYIQAVCKWQLYFQIKSQCSDQQKLACH